jgi:hypothetical protein
MEHNYTPPALDFTESKDPIEVRYHAIKSMLSEYECIVNFTKVNGELRSMPCTLREDTMPASTRVLKDDIVEAEAPTNFDLITVWCTDMQAWRAMRTMNVISVILPPKKWVITVEEDPETGDAILPLPPELIKLQGWKEGDTLTWEDNKDGSWALSKKDDTDENRI